MIGLGLDAGGSATRWTLCDAAGTVLAAGEVAAISGHLYHEAERARLRQACSALAGALTGLARPGAVVAGITGLAADTDEAAVAGAAIAAALDLPGAAVRVREDTWIAYHAAFAPGAGHLIYAGTGSVGVHVRADRSVLRTGGRGMLIDDGGSAFWIGREALRAVWRRRDAEPDWTSPLAVALAAALGGDSWDVVRTRVYGGGRTEVAMLARAVAAAAGEDATAREILANAGTELGRLALALVRQEGGRPVVLTGRAAGLHPLILQAMRAAAPALEITLRPTDAALAAARLALDPLG
ncbi:ATPase [Rhodovastum atsumiense]|uniref:ATPase n=1 Tax=Rhodovastum atsumiense TaxID=504468 RepID=A0A5M6INI0_9PROT|nr:BadF/BadG/BcrA/BcrD ATPase family protein [Rhodovastum atsumiense]KAA5609118.1 ATPase [Rhodovastum atsumiense]CAH2603796.1 ATPase [Rhodovastum atsumiense]